MGQESQRPGYLGCSTKWQFEAEKRGLACRQVVYYQRDTENQPAITLLDGTNSTKSVLNLSLETKAAFRS